MKKGALDIDRKKLVSKVSFSLFNIMISLLDLDVIPSNFDPKIYKHPKKTAKMRAKTIAFLRFFFLLEA